MRFLLDTHSLIWMSVNEARLSNLARETIADVDNELFLSPVSFWEISIKISTGKFRLTESVEDFVGREIQKNELRLLPIELMHAAEVSRLPFHHRDPFDRMLVAQAIVEQLPIISADAQLDTYSVQRVW